MDRQHTNSQRGFVTLATVGAILLAASITSFYVAKTGIVEQMIYTNTYQTKQAESAAQAGLDYGLVYLNKHRTQIIKDKNKDKKIDAYSNREISNVKLTNGAHYTVNYINPIANDFNLLKLSATGISADGQRKRVINELVKFQPTLFRTPKTAIAAKGKVKLENYAVITNPNHLTTIFSGKSISIKNRAYTENKLGVISNKLNLAGDVHQNQKNLLKATDDAIFADIFGSPPETIYNLVSPSNIVNDDFSKSVDGKKGTILWLSKPKGTVNLNGDITIGSASDPVILIVDSNLKIQDKAVIYGLVYVTKNVKSASGNATVIGALITEGNLNASDHFKLVYDEDVMNELRNQNGDYAQVESSWRDW